MTTTTKTPEDITLNALIPRYVALKAQLEGREAQVTALKLELQETLARLDEALSARALETGDTSLTYQNAAGFLLKAKRTLRAHVRTDAWGDFADWLRATNRATLIKHQIVLEFPEPPDERVRAAITEWFNGARQVLYAYAVPLRVQATFLQDDPETTIKAQWINAGLQDVFDWEEAKHKETIHHSTLAALARRLVKEGGDVPDSLSIFDQLEVDISEVSAPPSRPTPLPDAAYTGY